MGISACTPGVPGYTSPDCGRPNPRNGGIKYLIWANSTAVTAINVDKTDMTVWQAQLNAGNVEIHGPLVADKPAATPNTQRLTSCSPESSVNYNHVINMQDFNTSNDLTAFYNDIRYNSLGLSLGFVECAGFFSGFFTDPVADISRIIEETADSGVQKWQGTVSYILKNDVTPTTWTEDDISFS